MMQRIFSAGRSVAPQIGRFPPKNQPCRKLSGGGHGHSHPPNKLDPYPIKHEAEHPEVAYLFNIKPGDQLEGWEIPVYLTYFVCSFILIAGVGYCKHDDSFNNWAKHEALAREKVVENGGTIEFGKWYQYPTFTAETIDTMPTQNEE